MEEDRPDSKCPACAGPTTETIEEDTFEVGNKAVGRYYGACTVMVPVIHCAACSRSFCDCRAEDIKEAAARKLIDSKDDKK